MDPHDDIWIIFTITRQAPQQNNTMPRAIGPDDAPLTQEFQTQVPTLPPIDDFQPSALSDALDLESATSNCVSIVVPAPPDDPPADNDDPSG